MAYESYQSLSENNCFIDSSMNDSNSKNSYRLVLMGAPKVGKSSILNWFLSKPVDHSYVPTIEDFHKKVFKIRGDVYRLDILDTSGNDPFPAMKKLNIMTGDIFILVFSLDNVDSYTQVRNLLQLIVELKKPTCKQESKGSNYTSSVPILVVGNKLDMFMESSSTSSSTSRRCAELGDIQHMVAATAGPRTAVYAEISALQSMGIETAFERLFGIASLPLDMLPMRHRTIDMSVSAAPPVSPLAVATAANAAGSAAGASNGTASSSIGNDVKVTKTESVSNIDTSTSAANDSIAAKKLSGRLSGGFSRASSLKLRKNAQTSNATASEAPAAAPTTVAHLKPVLQQQSALRRSFRKVTFRRSGGGSSNESWGAVWLNARRPSIRAELKLLQAKKNPTTTFKYHDYENTTGGSSSSSSSPTTKSPTWSWKSSSSGGGVGANGGAAGFSVGAGASANSTLATRTKFRMLVNNFKNLVCTSDRSMKSSKLL